MYVDRVEFVDQTCDREVDEHRELLGVEEHDQHAEGEHEHVEERASKEDVRELRQHLRKAIHHLLLLEDVEEDHDL